MVTPAPPNGPPNTFGGTNTPSRSASSAYVIKPGDTAASIAQKLGIPLATLLRSNPQIEHNGKMVPLTANMPLSNGHLFYPASAPPTSTPPPNSNLSPLEQELQGMPGQERDAYAALTTLFNSYGLGTLAPKILNYLQNGYGSDTITILLQQTPEY
jgi:hypothetical protein